MEEIRNLISLHYWHSNRVQRPLRYCSNDKIGDERFSSFNDFVIALDLIARERRSPRNARIHDLLTRPIAKQDIYASKFSNLQSLMIKAFIIAIGDETGNRERLKRE